MLLRGVNLSILPTMSRASGWLRFCVKLSCAPAYTALSFPLPYPSNHRRSLVRPSFADIYISLPIFNHPLIPILPPTLNSPIQYPSIINHPSTCVSSTSSLRAPPLLLLPWPRAPQSRSTTTPSRALFPASSTPSPTPLPTTLLPPLSSARALAVTSAPLAL